MHGGRRCVPQPSLHPLQSGTPHGMSESLGSRTSLSQSRTAGSQLLTCLPSWLPLTASSCQSDHPLTTPMPAWLMSNCSPASLFAPNCPPLLAILWWPSCVHMGAAIFDHMGAAIVCWSDGQSTYYSFIRILLNYEK